MKNTNAIQPYKKDFIYSYTSGAYATIEMLNARPHIVQTVYIHSKFNDKTSLTRLCEEKGVRCVENDRCFERVTQKENSYVMGVFDKYYECLSDTESHVVLVNPSDMGNMGTIIRTVAGFGINNLGIILPAGDIFHPKTIRASMGALFSIRFQCFDSFAKYRGAFEKHHCFPFMLDGRIDLTHTNCPREKPFSLIFGNEATGLPQSFAEAGISVRIPQSTFVDSYNVAVAVGIGAYIFSTA